MRRRGFTIVELMTVIAILGVLASIAIMKSKQSKDRALRASLLVDLKTLVSAEEGFFSANKDYAGKLAGAEVPGVGGAGTAAMTPSTGNTVTLTYRGTDGWSATITNSSMTVNPKTCGIFIGPTKYSPNAKVTSEGVAVCY